MISATDQTYVTYTVTHPAQMNDETRTRFMQAVQAGLQSEARRRSLSIPEDATFADYERVDFVAAGIMDTEEGPVEVRISTYRATAVAMTVLPEGRVLAVEQEDGTWVADIPPGMPVVEVQHGLASYDVDVIALDAERIRTGHNGFVPITKNSVEVLPLPPVAHVIIRLPRDEEGAHEHSSDADADACPLCFPKG
jgi:hypothetical protein